MKFQFSVKNIIAFREKHLSEFFSGLAGSCRLRLKQNGARLADSKSDNLTAVVRHIDKVKIKDFVIIFC